MLNVKLHDVCEQIVQEDLATLDEQKAFYTTLEAFSINICMCMCVSDCLSAPANSLFFLVWPMPHLDDAQFC